LIIKISLGFQVWSVVLEGLGGLTHCDDLVRFVDFVVTSSKQKENTRVALSSLLLIIVALDCVFGSQLWGARNTESGPKALLPNICR